MPNSQSDPSQSIAALVGDLSRLMRRSFNRHVRNTGLTYPQWRAIVLLSKEQGINQTVLAERMDVQPISLARLIDRMEAAGWIERNPDPRDRRAVQLFLTDKAQPILEEIHNARGNFEEGALIGISASERDRLRQLLNKIKVNLAATDSEPESTLTPSRTK